MKLLNATKNLFPCFTALLLALLLINTPAFSENIKSLNEINDNTINGLARKDMTTDTVKLSLFNKDNGLINLESDIRFFSENLTIDMTLKDVDVASILRIIAGEGHKNIVIDQSVMGNISAELKKISLNQAMQVILTSQELEARLSNNTIFVASRPVMAKKGLNRRFIKTFKLNNSNPVEIAQILEASIFNKGYKVSEKTGGTAMAEIASGAGQTASSEQQAQTGSSTGQSSLADSKIIKGKVEEIIPGANFGDAGKLASTIQIQQPKVSTQPIQINNNDGGAIVIPDTRTNSILVAGLKEDILMAEEAIKTLDKALRQVSIEVSLIELKKDDTSNIGVLYNTEGGSLSGGFNSVTGEFPGYGFSSLANQSGVTLNTLSSLNNNFAAKLNTLITNKKAKLLANPQILALDGSESLIKITDQVVSKVTTTITQTSTTYNTEIADVGIVLNILPKIGDDDYITMKIRPSITDPLPEITVGDFLNGGAAVKITPVSTREVILQNVRVKSGETLAIAGLTKENNSEIIGKIPLLGDLLGVGKLFQNKEYIHNKTELIILITPKIVDEPIATAI
ncbi:MAG: secretin N-terminal domain-containing protein [bacterium]